MISSMIYSHLQSLQLVPIQLFVFLMSYFTPYFAGKSILKAVLLSMSEENPQSGPSAVARRLQLPLAPGVQSPQTGSADERRYGIVSDAAQDRSSADSGVELLEEAAEPHPDLAGVQPRSPRSARDSPAGG
uniref:Pecanex-like protein n=1 Tax=Macrostomum lignano TaxID=282301 RepID=A0A1I8J460_9PLAT